MTDVRLEDYLSDTRRYDELLDSSGDVRAHWRPLIDALANEGADAVRHGVELARRLIVENGVTYNVYADPQGRDRPWVLDPLPVLITADEWCEIELGVAQRARLFDALLSDVYGPQRLLADGTVPATNAPSNQGLAELAKAAQVPGRSAWANDVATPIPAAAGAATGLFAGGLAMAVYCLHCPETEPAFIATWYSLGAILTAALGAGLGPTLLRWR